MPAALRNLSKTQIFGIIGFAILLIGIPIGLFAIKQTQSLNSSASAPTPVDRRLLDLNNLNGSPSAKTNPLNEIKNNSASQVKASPSPSTEPSPNATISFGPTLNLKIAIEGRLSDKHAAKVFVGIASGTPTERPTYLLSFTVDFPNTGIFQGLSMAGLDTGETYTAFIKGPGQIATSSAFILSPSVNLLNNDSALTLISGDLNEDNIINNSDYSLEKSLFGTTAASENWNERADFNLDGVINNADLTIVRNNLGKTGAGGTWFSPPPPTATSSASLNSGTGGYTSTQSSRLMPIKTTGGYWLWVPQ